MAVCKNCGAEIPDGVKFCNKCGTPVDAAASTEAKSGINTEAIGEKVSDVTNKGKEFFNENVKNFQSQDKNTQTKLIIIAAVCVAAIICVLAFAAGGKKRVAKSYLKAFEKGKIEKMEKLTPKFLKKAMDEDDIELTDFSQLAYYADEYDLDSVDFEIKSVKKVDKDDIKDFKEAFEDEYDFKAKFSKAYQVKYKLSVKFDDDDMDKIKKETYYFMVVKEGFGWKVIDTGRAEVEDFIDYMD